MNIEFDASKARANLRKHRVSFDEAVTVFFDPMALCIEDLMSQGESRWVLMGMSHLARMLTVVYTLRNEQIRIISARRSTRREIKNYA